MEYMPELRGQVWSFIYSAGLGFCLGLIYDFFRILFFILTGSDKKFAAARDIIYMFVLLWVEFVFLLTVYLGKLMFYAFAGEAAGICIYFFSFSAVFYRPVKTALKTFGRKIGIFFNKFNAKLCFFCTFARKKLKKFSFFSKKYLHIRQTLLYNHSIQGSRENFENKLKRGAKSGRKEKRF